MLYRRPYLYALACSASLIVAFALAGTLASSAVSHSRDRVECFEDQPCWTWSTMGNRKRGIVLAGSRRHKVVGVCAFKRLDRRGRIDWHRTDRIRGDMSARRHKCQTCKSARD